MSAGSPNTPQIPARRRRSHDDEFGTGDLRLATSGPGLEVPTRDVRLATKDDARYCRDLTRREAANFYWGFVVLPRDQRTAIYALYSFAREVDDDVDGAGDHTPLQSVPDEREAISERFRKHRARLERCYSGAAEDPVMRMLSDIVVRYEIPQSDLEGLIDGVEMDLAVTRYHTWDDARRYCELVASTIGRMCVRVFSFSEPAALKYADDLGVAMQLTNILRDVREDAAMGRVYLPQDELKLFGVPEMVLSSGERTEEWEALARFEIERAHELFDRGLRVTTLIPRRAAACVLTMAGIYERLLAEMEHDPYLPLRGRASLSGTNKLAVMLRSWLRAA